MSERGHTKAPKDRTEHPSSSEDAQALVSATVAANMPKATTKRELRPSDVSPEMPDMPAPRDFGGTECPHAEVCNGCMSQADVEALIAAERHRWSKVLRAWARETSKWAASGKTESECAMHAWRLSALDDAAEAIEDENDAPFDPTPEPPTANPTVAHARCGWAHDPTTSACPPRTGEEVMPRLPPGFLSHPKPPVARVPGHDPGCFDGNGNFRCCVPGCRAWDNAAARERAFAEYEAEKGPWLDKLKADEADRRAARSGQSERDGTE